MSVPSAGGWLADLAQVPDPRGRLRQLPACGWTTTSWSVRPVDGGGLRLVMRSAGV